jgi:hypothetical protein
VGRGIIHAESKFRYLEVGELKTLTLSTDQLLLLSFIKDLVEGKLKDEKKKG